MGLFDWIFISLWPQWNVPVNLSNMFSPFIGEIIEWAKNVFENLASYIRKAWVSVRRIPGAIRQYVHYIKDGKIYEVARETMVLDEELCMMLKNDNISQEEYEALTSEVLRKIAELNRNGNNQTEVVRVC